MDLQTAIRTVFGKYAVFTGRAARSEFWYWVLFIVLVSIGLSIIDGTVIAPMTGHETFAPEAGQPLQLLFNLATLLPTLAVSVRRLHDTDRSGWWLLLGLIPIIGNLILLWWYIQAGTPGDNEYGPPAIAAG
jgi:uncharacterized membrane protein YhaH (DUF805 family)